MKQDSIQLKAERIRDVIRYISRFKNATVVIYIDDNIIDSSIFANHIHDISLIKEAGLKVLIVPGAHRRIDTMLKDNKVEWTLQNGIRVTTAEAMPLIKTAAFEVANNVMTSLAGEHLTAVIGNWVRARGKGVVNGIDYGTAGEIDKIDDVTLNTVLNDGIIPIFPCIGWSLNGKPYNISSMQLAAQLSIHIKADKLFFLVPDAELTDRYFVIPKDIGLSPEGNIPAMNIQELNSFIELNSSTSKKLSAEQQLLFNRIISILELSKSACESGVSRSHILNGSIDGIIPCEIFSNLGSGTMIYSNNYGKIRAMRREDIPQVMSVTRPFVENGILLPKSEKYLETHFNDFIIYEIDGSVRACAALHIYDRTQAEIASVAVDETCSHIGIGPKMIEYLINKAKSIDIKSIFILTTQTADWFESLGFKADKIESIPSKRKEIWTPERNSKVFRLNLN